MLRVCHTRFGTLLTKQSIVDIYARWGGLCFNHVFSLGWTAAVTRGFRFHGAVTVGTGHDSRVAAVQE